MNIDYLIQLLSNKLTGLTLAKDQAFSSGDLDRITAIDTEMLDVQNTISKLKLVASIEQAAAATTFTEAQVVQNGIEASFNPTVINDATKCLLEFNIEPYATDPEHEMKIQSILEKMPLLDGVELIDIYLKRSAPSTPLSGQMILNSSSKYNVDIRLMLALMELDSRFGTEGVGARTNNPGNVGNTGTAERMYSSWDEGVDAVALWLSRHRRITSQEPAVVPQESVKSIESTEKVSKKVTVESVQESTSTSTEPISASQEIPLPANTSAEPQDIQNTQAIPSQEATTTDSVSTE